MVVDPTTIFANKKILAIGSAGIMTATTEKCNAKTLYYHDCGRNDYFPQNQEISNIFLNPVLQSNGKSLLRCDPTVSTEAIFQNPQEIDKIISELSPYFMDDTCKSFPAAKLELANSLKDLATKYSKLLNALRSNLNPRIDSTKVSTSESPLLSFLLYLKYLELPNPKLPPFKVRCANSKSQESISPSSVPPSLLYSNSPFDRIDFESFIKDSFLLASASTSADLGNEVITLIDSRYTTETQLFSPAKVASAGIALAANSTSAVSAQGTQAIPTAPRISVAQLQEAVRSNRPESQGVIAAFTRQAIGEATHAVSQIPSESWKAIGGSPASFLAASQRALAANAKVTVTTSERTPSTTATSARTATSTKTLAAPAVSSKPIVGAAVSKIAAESNNSLVSPNSGDNTTSQSKPATSDPDKTKSRSPASAATTARTKVASDAGRVNVTSGAGGVSLGGSSGTTTADPQDLQKRSPASNSINSNNLVVQELMKKEKSKEVVKALKSNDDKKKSAIEQKWCKDNIRIYDKNMKILCQGKGSSSYIFQETKDGSLYRLK
jgi:hypothetical protein